jgi:hypothetical protein
LEEKGDITMAYGNYAPFYRPEYFNPMQNIASNQFTQPYQPQQAPIQTPIQAPIQQTGNFNEKLWVLNENEATSFPVAPNNSVVLWDKNNNTIYEKSVNAQGVPSMRILDFKERTENTQNTLQNHSCTCGDKFVTKDAFDDLRANFDDLRAKVEAITEKPKVKTKKIEEE